MPGPIGVRPKSGKTHQGIYSIYQGDKFSLDTSACLPDGTVATPENSRLKFTLVDDRFCQDEPNTFFRAEWNDNIIRIPNNDTGGVRVTIPQSVTCRLRRGSYKFSLTLSDNLGQNRCTLLDQTLIVEYAADAPLPDAAYRQGDNTQNHTLGGLE